MKINVERVRSKKKSLYSAKNLIVQQSTLTFAIVLHYICTLLMFTSNENFLFSLSFSLFFFVFLSVNSFSPFGKEKKINMCKMHSWKWNQLEFVLHRILHWIFSQYFKYRKNLSRLRFLYVRFLFDIFLIVIKKKLFGSKILSFVSF